jgi:hypothetical protein
MCQNMILLIYQNVILMQSKQPIRLCFNMKQTGQLKYKFFVLYYINSNSYNLCFKLKSKRSCIRV